MAWLTEAEFEYRLDVASGYYGRKKRQEEYAAARQRALRDYMKPPDPFYGNEAMRRAVEQYSQPTAWPYS